MLVGSSSQQSQLAPGQSQGGPTRRCGAPQPVAMALTTALASGERLLHPTALQEEEGGGKKRQSSIPTPWPSTA